MPQPIIVFIPGLWVGPTIYQSVASILQTLHGYTTITVALPSTGTVSPGNPCLQDDVQSIRGAIKPLIETGKEVILVLHSAAGFLAGQAIGGLSMKERVSEGQKGWVRHIVFLAAVIVPEGYQLEPRPTYEYNGGRMTCKDPIRTFLNDLSSTGAKAWFERFDCQPATGWDDKITYCGWREIPSVYLVCENDVAVPLAMQRQMAEMSNSKIETCSAAHMAMISQPERVVEVIRKAAGEMV